MTAPDAPAGGRDPAMRIPELDGVRGLAALAIVLWHYIPSIALAEPATPLAYLSRGLSLCWAGVDLFFVLSGFLIGSILLRESGSPRYFPTFYARRAARIVPLYAVMLGALALGQIWLRAGAPGIVRPVFDNQLPWWSYAVFAQNLFMPGIDDFGPKIVSVTWSLAIEEQFYLLLPLLIWALPARLLAGVLVLLFVSAPLLRASVPAGMGTYVLLPFRLDSLMAGALLALVWRQPGGREWIARHGAWLRAVWCTLALPAPFLLKSGAGMHALLMPHGWWVNTWLALWFALSIALLLDGRVWLGTVFRSRVLQWLGRIAYGLYLLHPAVLWLLHLGLVRRAPVLDGARTGLVTLLAFGGSLICATLAYRWIEAPFLALGKRFKY